MDRRKFIQTSALASAGLFYLSSCESTVKRPIGLQLYSLRDVIMSDVKGTLKSVADWGYKEVETYGYNDGKLFGMPIAEFNDYVNGLGLNIVSGHYGIDLTPTWAKVCEDAKSIGQKFVVVPWLNQEFYSSLDVLKQTCETLNKAGEVANTYGLRMAYHNHAFEFDEVEGQVMFDVMLAELQPELVGIEMDLYWVYRANRNPVEYFEKHPGRFELWHVKDMDKTNRENNADVGTGSIDFKSLFAVADKAGMKNFFIEQETYPENPMKSVENSISYLKTIV